MHFGGDIADRNARERTGGRPKRKRVDSGSGLW
jgi:hypothetical protein